MSTSPFDASIPVLTEIFLDAPAPAPRAPTDAELLEQNAIEGWSVERWDLLERRVAERVLMGLQSRVDFVLEQRVRDLMADVLQEALGRLTGELRGGLHSTLDKIVTRAVAQEITHLRAQKA